MIENKYVITYMHIDKITTKTLRQQIYDQLRKKIIAAEILPGQVVTIQGLAKQFEVSVMPVREALWQLESEGVVVIESNKSIHVNALRRNEMEEILDLRLILEAIAAERACSRITEQGLRKMASLLNEMKKASGKPDKFLLLNSGFHFTLYSYAGSPSLLRIIDSLWARVGPYMTMGLEKVDHKEIAVRTHEAMCRALLEKDPEGLKAWLLEDLKQAARIITPLLEDPEDTGKGKAVRKGHAQGTVARARTFR